MEIILSSNPKSVLGESEEIKDSRSDGKPVIADERSFSNGGNFDETFKKPHVLASKGQGNKTSKAVHESLVIRKCDTAEVVLNYKNSVPYTEPSWSRTIEKPYSLEVIKSGVILTTIDLTGKPYFVFGRQSNCDIQLAHPTISRYHAVLQHRAETGTANADSASYYKDAGIYLYDLGSTHGTFVNKAPIPKQRYIRLHVGYIVKFGGSTRSYILQGPESEVERESEKSVTELKEEASSRKNMIPEFEVTSSKENIINEEDQGIDWGLGEDAVEESDLTENPYAVTQNEELYIHDPKKSLRGWFEREGEDLEYKVEEKNFGQFLCQVTLPLDGAHGRPLIAEALVKGKKKEAVIQCALEACRILDRMGLLRQANHESKKRKARNWEEDDFYESDDDTYLDRTGTIEKKREKRMRSAGKLDGKAETYDTLLQKHREILEKLHNLEKAINVAKKREAKLHIEENIAEEEGDALDAFMSSLNEREPLDKISARQQKVCFAELQEEEARLRKLLHITCPTSTPQLLPSPVLSIGMSGERKFTKEKIKRVNEKPTLVFEMQTDEHAMESMTHRPEIIQKEISEIESSDWKSKFIENKKKEGICSYVHGTVVGNYKSGASVQKHFPVCDRLKFTEGPTKLTVTNHLKKGKIKDAEKKDEIDPDYSLWVPPESQTGDGKTKLNEKFGY